MTTDTNELSSDIEEILEFRKSYLHSLKLPSGNLRYTPKTQEIIDAWHCYKSDNKGLHQENEHLKSQIKLLDENLASMQQTNQALCKKLTKAKSIMHQQRSALNFAYGFIDEVSQGKSKPAALIQIEKALALTSTEEL